MRCLWRFKGEHAVYGILGAYIPHEIEEVEAAQPVGVVGDYGLALREVYKAGHLPSGSRRKPLWSISSVVIIRRISALAGGVADAGGAAAQEGAMGRWPARCMWAIVISAT